MGTGFRASARPKPPADLPGVARTDPPRRRARPLTGPRTMSRRLQIVLPDPVAAQLEELAAAPANHSPPSPRQIVRNGVAARRATASDVRRQASAAPPGSAATERPPWLEPYGGDPVWWRETWGAIVALHGRYPRHLEHLKDGWWRTRPPPRRLRARRLAIRDRRARTRPPRGARLPRPARRLRPHTPPARRRRREHLEAGRTPGALGRITVRNVRLAVSACSRSSTP